MAPRSEAKGKWQRKIARLKRRWRNQNAEEDSRVFVAQEDNSEHAFFGNKVATTKYNLLTFIPKGLYEQFRRVANMYFLTVACLSVAPFSPVAPYTTFSPLALVVGISMLKEAIEDFKRFKQDQEQNLTSIHILQSDNSLARRRWADLRVGDVALVKRDSFFPADLLLLQSSAKERTCHVETKNLDGETNLKPKQALKVSSEMNEMGGFNPKCECEPPNNQLYTFSGALELENRDKFSLGPSNLLLRGSQLRNTEWVLGLVVYAGHDTKVLRNSSKAPSKRSIIERGIDYIVIAMLLLLFTMCLITGIAFGAYTATYGSDLWYIQPTQDDNLHQFDPDRPGLAGFLNFLTTFILLGYLIPISLYVSLEMVKVTQAWFLGLDRQMYNEETDTPAVARTSNLNEELGNVNTVLSDKTGTLTQNSMEFFKFSINGTKYGNGLTEVERMLELRNGNVHAKNKRDAPLEKGFNFRDERIDGGGWKHQKDSKEIEEAYRCLAICNTAIPEGDADPSHIEYQCESPDEEALVVAAKRFGMFLKRRETDWVTIEEHGEEKRYEILSNLEFSSQRKRQSVVCRGPDSSLVLYCKGADSVLFERLKHNAKGWQEEALRKTKEHLQEFANGGLRTLVLSKKNLNEREFGEWRKRFESAKTAITNRESKVEDVEEEIETNLHLLGATAIEDKLQEGVPSCIEALSYANINLWVLTGDKQDTAINIASACNLITNGMRQHIVNVDEVAEKINVYGETSELKEEARKSVKDQLERIEIDLDAGVSDRDASDGNGEGGGRGRRRGGGGREDERRRKRESRQTGKADGSGGEGEEERALIIEGRALSHALHKDFSEKLLKITGKCKSVVCCRTSPLQKSLVTALVKKSGKVTLSIGDGANDVGMIQTAQIGVGISGQEGRQAVMASDFALAQFKHLERLLLVHGRWNYRRVSQFVTYFFYKNIVFGGTLFLFGCYAFFSSQRIYNDWLMAAFNVLFAALPVILFACFDQDVSQNRSHQCVFLYKHGNSNNGLGDYFTVKSRSYWLLNGAYQAIFLFFFYVEGVYRLQSTDGSGKAPDLYVTGLAMYTAVIVTITLQLTLIVSYWNWMTHLAVWGTVAIWFISITLLSEAFPVSFSQDQYKVVGADLFPSPTYWLSLLPAVSGALLPDFVLRTFSKRLKPSDVQIVQEQLHRHNNCLCLNNGGESVGGSGFYPSLEALQRGHALNAGGGENGAEGEEMSGRATKRSTPLAHEPAEQEMASP